MASSFENTARQLASQQQKFHTYSRGTETMPSVCRTAHFSAWGVDTALTSTSLHDGIEGTETLCHRDFFLILAAQGIAYSGAGCNKTTAAPETEAVLGFIIHPPHPHDGLSTFTYTSMNPIIVIRNPPLHKSSGKVTVLYKSLPCRVFLSADLIHPF